MRSNFISNFKKVNVKNLGLSVIVLWDQKIIGRSGAGKCGVSIPTIVGCAKQIKYLQDDTLNRNRGM